MTLYVAHLHQSVMNAWKQFAATTEKISKDNDADHKAREQHHTELEGQRRRVSIWPKFGKQNMCAAASIIKLPHTAISIQ